MNANLNTKRILCYGDSNTWGADPSSDFRYPANVRWTGLLQQKLGNDFEIIEEGFCGRTTVMDDPKEEGRNGKTYLIPCLGTHNPLDMVILVLGTNDLKARFNISAEQIAKNIEGLITIIKKIGLDRNNNPPKVILVCPTIFNENSQTSMDGMEGAGEKSQQLGKFYKEVAERQNCEFVDLNQYIQASPVDGGHLEKEAHAKIAEVLAERIKDYC